VKGYLIEDQRVTERTVLKCASSTWCGERRVSSLTSSAKIALQSGELSESTC
jgi:hypothetical protein